jgi:putative ABC transport system permease protein
MLRNYLLIAFRNLTKNAGYTSINVFGLAIGLACCLMVTLYVQFELSYDNFHENKAHLYRYIPRGERDGQVRMQTYLPAGFAPLMKENFKEIEMFTRFTSMDDRPLLKFGDKYLEAKTMVLADKDFFSMFGFTLIEGKAADVLSQPFSLVIAKSVADSYFPNGDAIGKIIRYDNAFDLEITGVFNDVPSNTHMEFTYVIPFESAAKIYQQLYGYNSDEFLNSLDAWNYAAYFYIPHHQDIAELAVRMDKKFTEARKDVFNPSGLGDWLQPLDEIHFTRGVRGDTATGDWNTIYIFSAVALLILLIACFNFMNLSTARAMKRAKEVGLRKVMGAFRHQLIKQFLGETLVLVTVSLLLAVVLLELMVPAYSALIGKTLHVTYFGKGSFLWIFLAAGLLTGVLAGSYPAFYLSSFLPAKVLKGQTSPSGNAGLRKVLTVLQFSVATFLLIGTLVIFAQMRFIQNTRLGFDQESIIYFNPPSPLRDKMETFKQILLSQSGVKSVSVSNGTPGMGGNSTWSYTFPGKDIPERSINTQIIDYDFLKTFGLELVEGRGLSREYATDSLEGYLINETLAKDLMLDRPVGTAIQAMDGHPPGRIVGVLKDYHYRTLHSRIDPIVLRFDSRNTWCMSVKFEEGNLNDRLATVEREWKKVAPDYPFTYEFLDDTIEQQYKADQNAGILLTAFSVLAILIACLGLLGLTAFMTEQRRKEIGVRKVLGASVSNIVVLLSKDFSKLVAIAFLGGDACGYICREPVAGRFRIQGGNQSFDLCQCRNIDLACGLARDCLPIDQGRGG